MSRPAGRPYRARRIPADCCEVCAAQLDRRSGSHRRRCADHVAQLALVTIRTLGGRARTEGVPR